MKNTLCGLGAEKVFSSYPTQALSFARGDVICGRGKPMAYYMAVASGRAKVTMTGADGNTMLLAFAERGAMLGDIELFTQNDPTDVIAVTPVTAVGIPFSYREEMQRDAQLLLFAASSLAEKLYVNSISMAKNMLMPLPDRLWSYIENAAPNGVFCENLTEIAQLMGTSYRHLMRVLARFSDEGRLLRTDRGFIVKKGNNSEERSSRRGADTDSGMSNKQNARS